ncbi:TerB family tellurite resistance protein [Asticcacaulis excentricus]|uniref:Heat shock protein DnaJ domain-containing protein n=1 Tax=Asticcacaulis excentricus (strain ATCC 15261 / DSM 4724 / KCTC 12464 / NCIMB 9791 / VKM B-1370 / CB 48) TaxID=573065 RepID=E8RRZ2_ASTEC|nr:TerB family tellurite resistance protein [Asticcacaulis excentricus]ADU13517.1 heat shock protein DnaJ domain-containing protein [Asticcacaulis excentricus CB 48]
MSFWKTLARKAAHAFDPADCTDCPKGQPGRDPAFATAVTALGAKLAMADGLVDESEEQAFFDVFQPEREAYANIRRLYDLARQTSLGFESYARRLAKRYAQCPRILEDVLEGLFHIAVSDGHLTDREETYLETVARLFDLSPATYRRIRADYAGPDADDPYHILGIHPDVADHEIRIARNRALGDVHPDRILARGLPSEYVGLFTQKAARINEAYTQILRERALQ